MSETRAPAEPALACPVCRAAFRAARVCARCGVDLTWLMAIVVEASRLTREGWQALLAGDLRTARACAVRALALHATDSARRLAWLAPVVRAGTGTH